jgi:hypothetical protein
MSPTIIHTIHLLAVDSLILARLTTLIRWAQTRLSRSAQLNAILAEPRTMDRTVPALLRSVPAYHTLQMRTQRAKFVNLATFILVYRKRLAGLGVQNTTLSRYEVLNVLNISL